MDETTRAAVTRALDIAIARVAEKEIATLSAGLSPEETATKICGALRQLGLLKDYNKPNYHSKWVALFYSLWYQPSQINLAYTLARKIRKDINPLRTGKGSLEVIDFGCGALAMQFGLALAAADAMQEFNTLPEITICSEDDSIAMKGIGEKIWNKFADEITDDKKYPELGDLSRASHKIQRES